MQYCRLGYTKVSSQDSTGRPRPKNEITTAIFKVVFLKSLLRLQLSVLETWDSWSMQANQNCARLLSIGQC
jgi:hypothetical protein